MAQLSVAIYRTRKNTKTAPGGVVVGGGGGLLRSVVTRPTCTEAPGRASNGLRFRCFPLLLSSYEGNPLSFRKSSFLHAHLSASAIPCTKLLQSSAILKIRNHTGKFTKLQELERKSPRFRCFSDFPRSCRFCFVSKISKPQQETHYMVWPTLINGRAGAER